MSQLVPYRNVVFDNSRWEGFRFRPDDIVISTPPKCGTTWMQTLCALLIFDTTELDRPLAEISPWLDMQTNSIATVMATLEAQQHRRFIKSHTPLDGLPIADGVTFLCVGRDPRDVALSFQHHWANLDIDAFMRARAQAVGLEDLAGLGPPVELPDDPAERFRLWVDAEPGQFIGPGLVDVLHHVQTFWDRRDRPGVHLFHYGNMLADLPQELRRLADCLAIPLSDDRLDVLADASSFEEMKRHADQLVPDVANGIWRSNADFFHRGVSGQWCDVLDAADLEHYHRRVAELVPPDLAAWAHEGWSQPAVTETAGST